jgi:hypothetical protein
MANDTDTVSDTSVPTNDAYTGMLIVSLLALIVGCVLLFMDYSQYSGTPQKITLPPLTKPAGAPEGKAPEAKQPQQQQPEGGNNPTPPQGQ